jgi:hypothetical protein
MGECIDMLTWQHPESFTMMTWQGAMSHCAELGIGWRLPTIQELLSLVDYSMCKPACKTDSFNAYYWSSTPCVSNMESHAWAVNFGFGQSDYFAKSFKFYVRAVRTQQ